MTAKKSENIKLFRSHCHLPLYHNVKTNEKYDQKVRLND